MWRCFWADKLHIQHIYLKYNLKDNLETMELMNAAVSVIPVDKKAKYRGLWGGFLSWTGAIFFYMLMKIGIGKK